MHDLSKDFLQSTYMRNTPRTGIVDEEQLPGKSPVPRWRRPLACARSRAGCATCILYLPFTSISWCAFHIVTAILTRMRPRALVALACACPHADRRESGAENRLLDFENNFPEVPVLLHVPVCVSDLVYGEDSIDNRSDAPGSEKRQPIGAKTLGNGDLVRQRPTAQH